MNSLANFLELLANPGEIWYRFSSWWLRGQFREREKRDFFRTMKLMLDGNVQMLTALSEIYRAYSEDGKKRRNIVAIVASDCFMQVKAGHTLGTAMRRWLADDESSLLEAGTSSGDVAGAFDRLLRIVKAKGQAKKAVASAVTYPLVLLVQCGYILNQVSTTLVPKMLRGKSPDSLEGPALLLKSIADFVTNYGAVSIVVGGIVLLAAFASLPIMTGTLRFYLDKVPPWSLYRMMYGSTFFLNVGVQMSAGIKLTTILTEAAERANPWLRERLEAALFGVSNGMTLGDALAAAEYDFPDRQAVYFLRAITSQKGAEENIEKFGEEWLEEGVVKLQRIAKVMLAAGIILNGMLILLVLVGASSLSDASISAMTR